MSYIKTELMHILYIVKDKLALLHKEIGESENSTEIIEDFRNNIAIYLDELGDNLENDRIGEVSEPFEKEFNPED